ncbi:MAG: nucleoside hydrolase [Candidatus Glassbacteria bacterium]|nr:nucleoside hydrolase [Candidatus Glassbacteria bacterium]
MTKLFCLLGALVLLSMIDPLYSPGARADESAREKIKVIIDTDIAEDIDDILVTAFAVASPEFEVMAITTVDGNVRARSRVARKVALLFGHPEIPVAEGYVRGMPLEDTTYAGFSGGVRYGEVAPDEQGLPAPSPLRADRLIAGLAEKYPGEISLVTIGSMGNVGHLLVRYPEAVKKLKRIVTNGGNFTGSDNQSIGWNLRYDPVAVAMTIRSRVPWVLLSESASRYASLRAEDVGRLKSAGLPSTELLVQAIHWWRTNKTDATSMPHVSDLNVFAYLLGGRIETTSGEVRIEIGPGGTLPGLRVEEVPSGRVQLGRLIPREKAEELREIFMQRLLSPPPGAGAAKTR